MKYILFFIFLGNFVFAQKYLPFNIDVVEEYADPSDKIKPVFRDSGFVYINIENNQKVFNKIFQEAYPFHYNTAMVKSNAEYYFIDQKGNSLVDQDGKPLPEKNAPDFVYKPKISNIDVDIMEFYWTSFNLKKRNFEVNYRKNDPKQTDIYILIKKGENGKYGFEAKNGFGSKIYEAEYDTILPISKNFIVGKKNGKYGVVDYSNIELIPFLYDDALSNEVSQYVGLKKRKKWLYFDEGEHFILKSKSKISKFINDSESILGTVENKGKFKTLYKNGELSQAAFDYISKKGNIGKLDNDIFYINKDRTSTKYFSWDSNKKFNKINYRTWGAYGGSMEIEITKNRTVLNINNKKVYDAKTESDDWQKLTNSFDLIAFTDLGEAGNRTKVDGHDVVLAVEIEGIRYVKYTPIFYNEESEILQMRKFNKVLEDYINKISAKRIQQENRLSQ